MIKPSIGWGRRMDYEVDQFEWGREQGNVTKSMTSVESKADKGEASETPMDLTIIGIHAQNRVWRNSGNIGEDAGEDIQRSCHRGLSDLRT